MGPQWYFSPESLGGTRDRPDSSDVCHLHSPSPGLAEVPHSQHHTQTRPLPQPNFSKPLLWLLINTSPKEQEVFRIFGHLQIRQSVEYSPHPRHLCLSQRQLRLSFLRAPAPRDGLASWCHWGLWTWRKTSLSLSNQVKRSKNAVWLIKTFHK